MLQARAGMVIRYAVLFKSVTLHAINCQYRSVTISLQVPVGKLKEKGSRELARDQYHLYG